MRMKMICAVIACVIGLSFQAGLNEANAQSANSGKTDLKGDALYDALSPGLQKKFEPDGNGGYNYTGNGRLNDKFAGIRDSLNADAGGGGGGGDIGGSGGTSTTVCSTTLDDEQMRLCLGLPAVKKAVRVKRLNVQIGKAE